jgi:hypothetical protein
VTAALAALALLGPVVVHDARESAPLGSVARAGEIRQAASTVYERRAPGGWVQWWLAYPRNGQDRGILRTGRHTGDWEMVQVRLERGRPVEAVYAQHSGAERCPWSAVEKRAGRPVIYVANGSHAAYFHAGTRDRTWPEPNDEARGDGAAVVPRVVRIRADAPAWMRFRGSWGGAEAGWFPGEQSSPPGPAFQPQGRWSDPAGWAAAARPCTFRGCNQLAECDWRETGALIVGLAGVLAVALWRTRPKRRRREPSTRATA